MKKSEPNNSLRALAKACGIQLSYRDLDGRIKHASSRSLLLVIRSLGIDVSTLADCSQVLLQLHEKRARRITEPVVVAWEGRLPAIKVRLFGPVPKILKTKLELEHSEVIVFTWENPTQFSINTATIKDETFHDLRLPIKDNLPFGYHRLTIAAGKVSISTLIISAPLKAPESTSIHGWGFFCPLYAVHSDSSWGAGDFSDLLNLAQWSASLGGSIVATLPLLPAFYRENFNPSPYSPISRLFWNEFFIDVTAVPELAHCPEAAELLASNGFETKISELRSEPLVDYARQMELKRRVLEPLAECFFLASNSNPRRKTFLEYLKTNPNLKDYARFRAVSERLKLPYPEWPENLRNNLNGATDYDPKVERYFLYTQFVAREQLADISSKVKSIGQDLYLDLPLGANPDGYDVWKNKEIFARGSRVGAPPDPAFPGGQDWGFPPLHPDLLRESGYTYFIDVIRHHLRFASLLRLDHIMGLHRLYWIPDGLSADEGVYVRYEAEEMYAILCLEAHRTGAMIVGEDLGLVPERVRTSMRRHNIYRSYVAQYEMLAGNDNCLEAIPGHAVAAVNTHDMHPFAAFWPGTDIEERKACGVLSPERAAIEISRRNIGKETLLRCLQKRNLIGANSTSIIEFYHAICRAMAASNVVLMLLNIDDLCSSKEAQNIPGTCFEHPNWRRRESQSLEQLESDQGIGAFISEIDRARRTTR